MQETLFVTVYPRFVYFPTRALIYPNDTKTTWVSLQWLWEVQIKSPDPTDDDVWTWKRVAFCNLGAAEVLVHMLNENNNASIPPPPGRSKRPPRTVIPFRKKGA